MENRLNSAIRTYAFSKKYDVNIILSEIQLMIDEEIDYDPVEFKSFSSNILESPYLLWDDRILLLKKLKKLGISAPPIYNKVPTIEHKIFNHDLKAIQQIVKLGVKIHKKNFDCLMTDDKHLPFLYLLKDLVITKRNIRDQINIAIRSESWKIVDFLLSFSGIVYICPSKKNTVKESKKSIVYELLQKGEDKFLKYIPKFCEIGLKLNEDICRSLLLTVEKDYKRAFSFLTSNCVYENYTYRSAVNFIIDNKKQDFLYCLGKQAAIDIMRKVILAEWFIGMRTLIESTGIISDDPEINIKKNYSWFNAAYRPTKKEFMIMFEYLKKFFPARYESWKNISISNTNDDVDIY